MLGIFAKKIPYDALAGAKKFNQSIATIVATEAQEVQFDVNNNRHLARVRECTAAVNQHLSVLQNRDKHIATGFGIAGAALALSAVIPFGLTIAMSGIAYGAYFLGGRDEPYYKFNAALADLAHCCDCALSDDPMNRIKNNNIKDMLKTLAPLVTKEDLITIMGNEKEADRVVGALNALNKQNAQTSNEIASSYRLATRNDLHYHLYGYEQGGTLASLANVAIIYFQKAFAYIWRQVSESSNNTHAATPCI